MSKKNWYEELGGYEVVERVIADFYQSVLGDDRINKHYIEGVSDIPKLHTSFAQFFSFILGGPNNYTGRELKEVHKNMTITSQEYQINWQHFEVAFLKNGMSKQSLAQVKEYVYGLSKHHVVTVRK